MVQTAKTFFRRRSRLSSFAAGLLAVMLFLLVGPVQAADHPLPPAKDASAYPDVDARADDQVAIAADPFDTPSKVAVFRVDYLKYGFMPLRIIVTNNGDRPISLNDVRIHLITRSKDRIPAAEPEDVERKVATKDRIGKSIPIGPLKIHRGGKDADSKVEQDFSEFEYSALAVEPHTTRAGFLFYDVEELGHDPLKGARLVFRQIRDADGKELFFFEVPFDKYLATVK